MLNQSVLNYQPKKMNSSNLKAYSFYLIILILFLRSILT